jgi:hypothetical protein
VACSAGGGGGRTRPRPSVLPGLGGGGESAGSSVHRSQQLGDEPDNSLKA